MNKDEIRNQIIEAFQDNVYPGDSRLVSLDPLAYGEHQEYYERIQGKTWRELLNELDSLEGPRLYYFSAIFAFLTTESFFYYLPAFLITAMNPNRADTTSMAFFYYIDPNGNVSEFHSQLANRLIEKLNKNQKEAVRSTVAYVFDQYPEYFFIGHDSLREYWLSD